MISGFRHEVNENCALLGCYLASSSNLLTPFRDNLSDPSSKVKNPKRLNKDVETDTRTTLLFCLYPTLVVVFSIHRSGCGQSLSLELYIPGGQNMFPFSIILISDSRTHCPVSIFTMECRNKDEN